MTESPELPPNIFLIVTDDMGACDLGFYGNPDARTPHLDRLAKQSLRHESFYVTPVCAPTRAALLTGRHHLRVGVSGVHGGKDHISLQETLLPEVLKSAGYQTGIWGKWHSGTSEGYLPHQRGFDESLRLQLYRHRDPRGIFNGDEDLRFPGKWGDEIIVDCALDFAQRHATQPVFGLLSSMTPHGPLDAPESDIIRRMHDDGLSRNLATLHAQMSILDTQIGRLREGLEKWETGGRETRILFMSDNGPAMFEDEFTDEDRNRRKWPRQRGWKGDVWEGGIRSPLFLHQIGKTESGEIHTPSDVTDLFPTFAAWAGASFPVNQKTLDGRDLSPLFRGEPLPPKVIYHWVHPAIPPAPGRGDARLLQDEYGPVPPEEKRTLPASKQVMALRNGDWKLTRHADLNRPHGPWPSTFLALLSADPLEQTNLSSDHPERVQELNRQLDQWWEEILYEPASFQAPLQTIPSKGPCEFSATTCSGISKDLRNTGTAIQGFRKAGQYAAWSLHAESIRTFTPELLWHHETNVPPGTRFAFECSGSECKGCVKGDRKINWDQTLDIDAGPNTLKLTVLDIPEVPSDLQLTRLRFVPPFRNLGKHLLTE